MLLSLCSNGLSALKKSMDIGEQLLYEPSPESPPKPQSPIDAEYDYLSI